MVIGRVRSKQDRRGDVDRSHVMGLVVHGASGRTWISMDKRSRLGYSPVSPTSFHHEVGVSLILFHLARLDFVRRLDRPDWGVGLSLVRLDFAGPEDK